MSIVQHPGNTSLRTGAQYLAALDDGRQVYVEGRRIENVATDPLTRDYARRVADYFDLHHDPALQDAMTFVDDDGVRRSRAFQLPRNKDEILMRREFHATVSRHIGFGQFGRLPDANTAVMMTMVDDPLPWERNSVGTEGRGLAENIRSFWARAKSQQWNVTPVFIDSQPDRSSPDAFRNSPDLRLVGSDDEGITVHGVKAVCTGAVFGDWFNVGAFFRPGIQPDQCLFFFVKANTPGITMVARKTAFGTGAAADRPLSGLGDELDSFQHFEHVKIPWSQVSHVGNVEHTQHYPQRVFDWLHYADLCRQTVKAEMMAGLAILLTEVTGTAKMAPVQLRVADIMRFREAVRAHLIAADDTGFITPGGLYKPNNLLFDFGRAYFNEHSPLVVQELLDLAGRGPMMIPADGDWENPALQPWLGQMLRGPAGEGAKLKVYRIVRDLFVSEWGRRNAMFDQFNGTPITAIRYLTMQRAEFQPDGPVAALARKACGLAAPVPVPAPAAGGASLRDEVERRIFAQDARTR